jgi:hypothetical protein
VAHQHGAGDPAGEQDNAGLPALAFLNTDPRGLFDPADLPEPGRHHRGQ